MRAETTPSTMATHPHRRVTACRVVDGTSQPHAENGAHLVAEEDHAVERCQVSDSKEGGDCARSKRNGAQPQKAHDRAEDATAVTLVSGSIRKNPNSTAREK